MQLGRQRLDAERAGETVCAHMELSRRRMTEFVAPPGLDVPLAPPLGEHP